MTVDRGRCRDCDPDARRRPAPHPGPRCASHHREVRAQRRIDAHDKRVQQVYGLGPGDYDRIYEAQGGVCYICQRAKGTGKRRLAVDHDHRTGAVRGLLCKPCNRDVLGHLRDDVSALERAIRYLISPPAREVLMHAEDSQAGVAGTDRG